MGKLDGCPPSFGAQGVRDDCPFPPAAAGGIEAGLGQLYFSRPAFLPPIPARRRRRHAGPGTMWVALLYTRGSGQELSDGEAAT